MIYLASPYSRPDAFVREQRYLQAAKATVHLLHKREWVYSPIVHCHTIAQLGDLPKDFDFWRDYNFAMLEKADKLLILRVEGWENSVGVKAEIAHASQLNKPVEYL